MNVKSKYLADAGWKDLASRSKLKDNGLVKALERLKRVDNDAHEEQGKTLDEVIKLAGQLKKDKAVVSLQVVSRYLAEVQADAEAALRDVAKAKAEHEKAQKAKAEAEKKAAARQDDDEGDDDEVESPELLTTKLKPLLKLVAKGETMHALLAKSGKQVVVMLSRKPIPPARRKLLAEQLGGGSTKYYPGTCGLESGATTFALKAEVAGMSKLVKSALLEQTGMRLNKIKCRGEDGDDDDSDDDGAPPPAGKSEGDNDAAAKTLAAAPDESQPGGLAPSGSPTPRRPAVPTITVETDSRATQVLAGSTVHFRAIFGLDGDPVKYVTREVDWGSSNPAVAVSRMGAAKIEAEPGPLTISATFAKTGTTGSITVMVVARIVEKIIITPKNPLVAVEEFLPLRAMAEFSDGTTEDVTARVHWESRLEQVALASSTGHCQGKVPGKAIIWAVDKDSMADGITEVTVHAAGKAPKLIKVDVTPVDPRVTDFDPRQLRAMGEFADKSKHEVTQRVRWISARPAVLAVNPDTGLATPGLGSEVVRITAATDDPKVYGYTEVSVDLPRLQSVDIEPKDPSVPMGDAVNLKAMGTFSSGPPRDITNQLTWSAVPSPSGLAMPVGNSGLIQSVAEGTCDISAIDPASRFGDMVTLTVLPPVITSIDITPAGNLQVNANETYVATATFSDLSTLVLTGPDVTWSSDDPVTLAIDPHDGKATAKTPGKTFITVTTPRAPIPGILPVTVDPPIVTGVDVTSDKPSVKVGSTIQLKATAKFSNKHTEDKTSDAYWSLDEKKKGTATVDESGKLTGVTAGKVSISATIDGQTGLMEVEVTP